MRLAGVSTAVLHVDDLDERDRQQVAEHTRAYWSVSDPRPAVGDFVRPDWAGVNTVRIAYLWPGHQFQPARDTGSFHLIPSFLRHSGSLDLPRSTRHLFALPKPEWGRCWIFHHGIRRPMHGLDVEIPRRVWVYGKEAFA
jgi:hypothetical protein